MKTSLLFAILLLTSVAQAELKLALNWKAEPQFGGFYEAERLGFFKDHKLDVKIQEGGSGTPTIQMLAAGQVEYAIISADELVIAHDRGAKDLVALFAVYHTSPVGIMTRAERNYKNLDEVFNSDSTLLWQSGLAYAQFLTKKYPTMKVKTAPYPGGIGAFLADKKIVQQCFVTSEPLIAERQGTKVKTFLVAESGYNPYNTVLVTSKKRFEKDKNEIFQIITAVRQGWISYLKNPSQTNEIMAKMNKSMTLSEFADSAKAQAPLILPTKKMKTTHVGEMEVGRWQELSDQLLSLGLVKKKVTDASEFMVNLGEVKK